MAATGIRYASGNFATQADLLTAGGLVLITTATASASASVSINSCFSAAFDNYRILVVGAGTADVAHRMRLRVSAADNSTANYNQQRLGVSTTTVTGGRASAQTSMEVGFLGTQRSHYALDIFSPQLAAATTMSSMLGQNVGNSSPELALTSGGFSLTTQFDGFTLLPDSGTFTTPTNGIRVYGYSNS